MANQNQSNRIRKLSGYSDLDRTDIALLGLLANNARASNKELAGAVGLAPSSCHQRLKVLHNKRVLLGSHAEIDFRALGFLIEALLFV